MIWDAWDTQVDQKFRYDAKDLDELNEIDIYSQGEDVIGIYIDAWKSDTLTNIKVDLKPETATYDDVENEWDFFTTVFTTGENPFIDDNDHQHVLIGLKTHRQKSEEARDDPDINPSALIYFELNGRKNEVNLNW